MGDCQYCGKPAGFMSTKHSECEKTHQAGRTAIADAVAAAIADKSGKNDFLPQLRRLEKAHFISYEERKSCLVAGWEKAVDHFLEDGELDTGEEQRLTKFITEHALTRDDLNRRGAYTKTIKATILRDILSGNIPNRVAVSGMPVINFQKDEKIVWAFPNTQYHEDKSRKQFVGGSAGVSIRVMKGVYYRIGAFKGNPVECAQRIHIDTGWLAITNRNIYFTGDKKILRMPYVKIISIAPYSDGISIAKDGANSKPQYFITNDGWFTYNLIVNLSRML